VDGVGHALDRAETLIPADFTVVNVPLPAIGRKPHFAESDLQRMSPPTA
jgi:hypothetical protein